LSVATPLPPQDEQVAIAQHIGGSVSSIDQSIVRILREVEFLSEYRTRLTADVVTGKFDVREAVKQLPAISEEPPRADELVGDEIDDEVPEEAEA
jgi:type I restriction enzyme S subunit